MKRFSIITVLLFVFALAACGTKTKVVEVEKPVIVEVPVVEPTQEMDCAEVVCAHSAFEPLCLRPALYDITEMQFVNAPDNHGIAHATMKGLNESGWFYDGKGMRTELIHKDPNSDKILSKYFITVCKKR